MHCTVRTRARDPFPIPVTESIQSMVVPCKMSVDMCPAAYQKRSLPCSGTGLIAPTCTCSSLLFGTAICASVLSFDLFTFIYI